MRDDEGIAGSVFDVSFETEMMPSTLFHEETQTHKKYKESKERGIENESNC